MEMVIVVAGSLGGYYNETYEKEDDGDATSGVKSNITTLCRYLPWLPSLN